MKDPLYRLYDGMNGDLVCASEDIEEIIEAAREYDEGCEGDWIADLKKQDEQCKYCFVENFSF